MIKYRYSLNKDFKNAVWTLKDVNWFRNHPDIVVFWPNPLRWVWLMFWLIFSKKPKIEVDQDVTCYWVSSGTWGSYHPDTYEIRICPWKINRSPDKNALGVIRHELMHLQHPEADGLKHEEKEKFIENLTKIDKGSTSLR